MHWYKIWKDDLVYEFKTRPAVRGAIFWATIALAVFTVSLAVSPNGRLGVPDRLVLVAATGALINLVLEVATFACLRQRGTRYATAAAAIIQGCAVLSYSQNDTYRRLINNDGELELVIAAILLIIGVVLMFRSTRSRNQALKAGLLWLVLTVGLVVAAWVLHAHGHDDPAWLLLRLSPASGAGTFAGFLTGMISVISGNQRLRRNLLPLTFLLQGIAIAVYSSLSVFETTFSSSAPERLVAALWITASLAWLLALNLRSIAGREEK